jgi:hypothetical protein
MGVCWRIDDGLRCQTFNYLIRISAAIEGIWPAHRGPGVHRPEALRFATFRNELQRDAVVAPAFPSRWRAVVKDMATVAGATRAMIFRTRQNQFEIRTGLECAGYRRKEAWPAGAAFVFHLERS